MGKQGLTVLDLFCGAGGFSEGFRQAGFEIIAGIDNWGNAREAHDVNEYGESMDKDLFKAIDSGGFEWVRKIKEQLEEEYGTIDVIIGSPPCTEFSYAKNGGKGDIEKGMLLVRAFLVFIAVFQPRFWVMENVPRLETAILTEGEKNGGFKIKLKKLGVEGKSIKKNDFLVGDSLLIPFGEVLVSSNYGCPQHRRRFVAGNIDLDLVGDSLDEEEKKAKTLREIIEELEDKFNESDIIIDPNYAHFSISKDNMRDYDYDADIHPLYWENMRHMKRRHIQYGRMSFPEDLDSPSRTIIATLNPSSREAIAIRTDRTYKYHGKERPIYRMVKLREAACLQGFPLSFQLTGNSLSSRHRLIGNAVPCQLSYALARACLDQFDTEQLFESKEQKDRYQRTIERLKENDYRPIIHTPNHIEEEADDFKTQKYMKFRAKPQKHFRRKLLSSKVENNSACIVFENTDWTNEGRKYGETWKCCIQLGVGGIFSQVFLDSMSIEMILESLNDAFPKVVKQARLPEIFDEMKHSYSQFLQDNPLIGCKGIVRNLLIDIENGLPVVSEKWVEFPGYFDDELSYYFELEILERRDIPTAKKFQELYTNDIPDIGKWISPLDFFDGIDYLMIKHLSNNTGKIPKWLKEKTIRIVNLTDRSSTSKKVPTYRKRISNCAVSHLTGDIPLITIIASLISVCICDIMHRDKEEKEFGKKRQIGLIRTAASHIREWCEYSKQ